MGLLFTISSLAYGLSAPLVGKVVDRVHPGAYASVYAVFNMAYAIGTIGTTFAEAALARLLSFGVLLLGVSAALLLCLPLLGVLRRSVGGGEPGAARVHAH